MAKIQTERLWYCVRDACVPTAAAVANVAGFSGWLRLRKSRADIRKSAKAERRRTNKNQHPVAPAARYYRQVYDGTWIGAGTACRHTPAMRAFL